MPRSKKKEKKPIVGDYDLILNSIFVVLYLPNEDVSLNQNVKQKLEYITHKVPILDNALIDQLEDLNSNINFLSVDNNISRLWSVIQVGNSFKIENRKLERLVFDKTERNFEIQAAYYENGTTYDAVPMQNTLVVECEDENGKLFLLSIRPIFHPDELKCPETSHATGNADQAIGKELGNLFSTYGNSLHSLLTQYHDVSRKHRVLWQALRIFNSEPSLKPEMRAFYETVKRTSVEKDELQKELINSFLPSMIDSMKMSLKTGIINLQAKLSSIATRMTALGSESTTKSTIELVDSLTDLSKTLLTQQDGNASYCETFATRAFAIMKEWNGSIMVELIVPEIKRVLGEIGSDCKGLANFYVGKFQELVLKFVDKTSNNLPNALVFSMFCKSFTRQCGKYLNEVSTTKPGTPNVGNIIEIIALANGKLINPNHSQEQVLDEIVRHILRGLNEFVDQLRFSNLLSQEFVEINGKLERTWNFLEFKWYKLLMERINLLFSEIGNWLFRGLEYLPECFEEKFKNEMELFLNIVQETFLSEEMKNNGRIGKEFPKIKMQIESACETISEELLDSKIQLVSLLKKKSFPSALCEYVLVSGYEKKTAENVCNCLKTRISKNLEEEDYLGSVLSVDQGFENNATGSICRSSDSKYTCIVDVSPLCTSGDCKSILQVTRKLGIPSENVSRIVFTAELEDNPDLIFASDSFYSNYVNFVASTQEFKDIKTEVCESDMEVEDGNIEKGSDVKIDLIVQCKGIVSKQKLDKWAENFRSVLGGDLASCPKFFKVFKKLVL